VLFEAMAIEVLPLNAIPVLFCAATDEAATKIPNTRAQIRNPDVFILMARPPDK
jgi:hypothetical protein